MPSIEFPKKLTSYILPFFFLCFCQSCSSFSRLWVSTASLDRISNCFSLSLWRRILSQKSLMRSYTSSKALLGSKKSSEGLGSKCFAEQHMATLFFRMAKEGVLKSRSGFLKSNSVWCQGKPNLKQIPHDLQPGMAIFPIMKGRFAMLTRRCVHFEMSFTRWPLTDP